MNSTPPTPSRRWFRTAARPGASRAGGLLAPLVLLAGLATAGCGDSPVVTTTATGSVPAVATPSPRLAPAPAVLAGLVVLIDDGGSRHLMIFGADGSARDLAGPPGTLRWASTDRAGRLLATMADGSLVLSSPLDSSGAGPSFRILRLDPPPGERISGPPTAAVLSPVGDRAVALGSEPLTGDRFTIIVADIPPVPPESSAPSVPGESRPSASPGMAVACRLMVLAGQGEGAPPAWLDRTRVAVLARDAADDLRTAVVDLVSGSVSSGPAAPILAAASEGGTAVAEWQHDGTVWIGPTASWLGGAASGPQLALGGERITGIALDAPGTRVAVGSEGPAGSGPSIQLFEAADAGSWKALGRTDPVATGSDVVAVPIGWLPPPGG